MPKQKTFPFIKYFLLLLLFSFSPAFAIVNSVSSIAEKIVGDTVDHSEFNSIVDTLKGFFNEDDGNSIGIGDTPTSALKLDVDGKIGATEYCNEDGTSCTASADIGGGKFFSGTILTDAVFSGGNVGIGTITPEASLHIKESDYDKMLILDRTENINIDQKIYISPTYLSSNETALDINIGTGGRQIRIQENGNVGIGTETPTAKLEIAGNEIITSVNRASINLNDNSTGGQEWTINSFGLASSEGVGKLGINQVGNGNRFIIDTSGNIGIGTTNPTAKLEVNGTIKATNINFSGIPTSTIGLSSGDVWSDAGTLKIMP